MDTPRPGDAPALALNEWAVLGALAERPTHGFALSREFAHDESIGRVWTIPRPLVYRALGLLEAHGLAREAGSAPGDGGPRRRVVEVTQAGRDALRAWLDAPVEHVRDARSELMVKLCLLDRSGLDPRPLLTNQAEVLRPMQAGLARRLAHSTGFEATILRWRCHAVEALSHFIEELLAEHGQVVAVTDRRRSRS